MTGRVTTIRRQRDGDGDGGVKNCEQNTELDGLKAKKERKVHHATVVDCCSA